MLWALGGCSKDGPSSSEENTATAPSTISLSPETLTAAQGGGDYGLTIKSPSRPHISGLPEWITLQDGTFKNYQMTVTLKVAANTSFDARTASLLVTAGSLSQSVSVSQPGRENPVTKISESPVTSGITKEGQALYKYLYNLYGKKTLSAVMAKVNWNNDIAQAVYQKAGKYPAINCYDFIHILYSGANWINYSNIQPVREWHNAGGIVSLMWHFNVPKTQAAPGAVDGVTTYAKETSFKASNVFVEGSWEQVWFDYYVDQVADVILQLQNAGIAALWRPFHEAAGNYYAKTYSGAAWFWWGAEGPEVCKKLWNRLWDAFQTKGIKNLIWVWTAQNYNGNSGAYDNDEAYYPGDAKVDVVARDLYGSSAKAAAQEFTQLQALYPAKMIALGECGWSESSAIGKVGDMWEAGGTWAWFMPWYTGDYTMVDTDWWKAAFALDYVITRDQVDL